MTSSSCPVLLRFALRGQGIRVLHLEPIGRAAGTVGRILPLRDGALEAGDFVQCSIPVASKEQLAEAHPQSPSSLRGGTQHSGIRLGN
jgi:hypothetical protein